MDDNSRNFISSSASEPIGLWTSSIMVGNDYLGSILNCELGIEALDADNISLGVFAEEYEAHNAVFDRWAASCESPPQPPEGVVDNPLTIARGYLERGWNPIPVSLRTKKPIGLAWQHRRLDNETVAAAFNRANMNVGVQLGPLSNGLTDVDLDCREAVVIGSMLLPASNNIFGRAGKPRSHWLYNTTLADSIAKAHLQFKDVDGAMMLELKVGGGGKGSQSVFPGSIHKNTGETIEWDQDGMLVTVDDDKLLQQVRRLAVAVMLARHWPADGSRHDAALTVGGFLARAGLDGNEVAMMLGAIATAAEDEQWEDRVRAGRDAVKQYSDGSETRGLPALAKAFGEKIALRAAEWLKYSTSLLSDAKGLPELAIDGSDPTTTAKELAVLIAKRDDFLFNGNKPVRITGEGVPRALPATIEMVRVLAHEICVPTKVTKIGERIPVPLSNDIAKLYLHGLEGRWGLKPFHGITTSPILSDDGVIRVASGYDAYSGLWCHNIPAITIPAQPTRDNAEQALRRLRKVFRTFPFADAARVYDPKLGVEVVNLGEDSRKPAGLDESIFLTALMTAVCRQSLELAPGCLCDAPNISGAGTGKGLLARAICVIASGVRPAAFTSGHDTEEFNKRLTSALIEARPAAFLDNYNNKILISDILSSALTENPASVRLFGHTKLIPLYTRTFIVISGNAVEVAEDMARRLLNIHLDARMENPELRPFQPGFLDRIFTERAALLTDALTIWRWGRQTELTPGKPLGSYEVWTQWCRDPLIALGMRDPVDRIAEIKAADPKRRMLVAIFERWWDIHRGQLVKAQELGHEIAGLIPGAVNRDGTVIRQKVAGFCAENTGTRVGGYALTGVPLTKKVTGYKLEREGG